MAAGVLGFWLVLGVVVASVAGSAISVLFSYWWFNFLLGGLIVALGVGMAGAFSMQLPRWIYAVNPRHDSYTGSFGFGVMTAVLATPCTGPFMGAAAGTVLTTGPLAALAVFTAIGLGMALPYGILTAAPGLVDRLPRTGPASELTKQVLALLMIAAGVFFLGTGVNALLSDGTKGVYQWYWWASAVVIALAGLWLIVRTLQITAETRRRLAFGVLGALLIGGSLGMAYEATRPSAIDWVYYTPQRFEQALAEGNTVMVDFTADWCINCKVLERAVLETRPVISALAEPDVVAMKVDLTGENPAGWAKLREAGRVAIPLLVVYSPDGEERFKSELYTVEQVVAALTAAKQ
jgi:thiol:disulfide interchange protein DsbD